MALTNQKELALFKEELDDLYLNRICSDFPRVSKKEIQKHGIIIYGFAACGKAVVNELLRQSIGIRFIVDKNKDLHGTDYKGIPIRPVSELSGSTESFVMLASTHIKDMLAECRRYNANKWILLASVNEWCHLLSEIGICNYEERYVEELLSSFALMADNKSRDVFRAYVKYHHVFDNDFSKLGDPVFYFPHDLAEKIDYSFFVDVGAFTGDTLLDWYKNFKPEGKICNYYAFEPERIAYKALIQTVSSLPLSVRELVHPINCAIGKENGFVNLQGGDGSAIAEYTDVTGGVPCKRIDDIFAELNPTIIKADVEGFEPDLLMGAEKTIRRCRPTLAISVYHRYSDLWTIPKWIDGLSCGYEIYLRHHPKVFTDTVCYAVPCC